MIANTYRKRGVLRLDEQNPYTGENETEKAMVYFFRRALTDIDVVGSAICDDDNEERTVFDRIAELEGKLDTVLEELRLIRTAQGTL